MKGKGVCAKAVDEEVTPHVVLIKGWTWLSSTAVHLITLYK